MKLNKILLSVITAVALFNSSVASAQALNTSTREELSKILTRIVSREILGGYVKEYTQEFYRKYGGEGKW